MKERKFIPVAEPELKGKELEYVVRCIETGWVSSMGEFVEKFEEEFAKFCQAKYAVSTANGTVALHLALAGLGIGPKDEVIVPSLTFVATANAVVYTGAKPVFADSEAETWNIDPAEIEKKITKRTRAIIPVHLYGHPANMGPIIELAGKYNLYVIEDAAEAHGAEYKERKVGGIGKVGCFSFYGNKIITTGEGGMVVTNDKKLAERMRFLKDHAMSKERRYYHPEIGFNYRLTNIQAALGVAQLERVDNFIERKRKIASYYNELLTGTPGIVLPPEENWAKNVYWMYSVLVTENSKLTRDELAKRLKEQGIDSRPFFYPIHKMPPYDKGERLPVAERLSQQGINLPSSVKLSRTDVERVAEAIKSSVA